MSWGPEGHPGGAVAGGDGEAGVGGRAEHRIAEARHCKDKGMGRKWLCGLGGAGKETGRVLLCVTSPIVLQMVGVHLALD